MAGDGDDRLAQTATAPGTRPSASGVAPLGDSLGRYKLQRELGSGAMGVVHAAFDPDLERRVALKVLRGSDSPEARQRLLREARAMARLTHPNVVTVHEVGSASGRDYVAMELIDGATLDDWLREGPRSEHEIVAAFVAAGRGLAAAHAAGLVHRDFKPRNVLRHKDGRIVVTDFGLVVGIEAGADVSHDETLRPSQLSASPSSMSGLTVTGSLLGTPAYMAPEQWTGAAIGRRPTSSRSASLCGKHSRRSARSAARRSTSSRPRSSRDRTRSTTASCRVGCARRCAVVSPSIRRSDGRA